MKLAPIALFVYNRLEHTQKTINALKNNKLSCESELFIYSDAAKYKKNQKEVKEVRSYIKEISGFKKVHCIERDVNFGLAKSIIDGVTYIINKFGSIIVLEDDHVTSTNFLKFMNLSLNYFENNKRIWHVSGWNYPIQSKELNDIYIWQRMECWGWATWKDRWVNFDKNPYRLLNTYSENDINKLNLDGCHDVWWQVKANKKNKINTWAIFWLTTIYENNGLCVNPVQTLVKNIGIDGTGVHCDETDIYTNILSEKSSWNLNEKIIINNLAVSLIKGFHIKHKKSFFSKVIRKLIKLAKLQP